MVEFSTIPRDWAGRTVVCAATGPSLTSEVCAAVVASGHPIIAVSDAWRALPGADMLYSSDRRWWRYHDGAADFQGERWSTSGPYPGNDKADMQEPYGLRLVHGQTGSTFSADPGAIRHGENSGFAALNIALLTGAERVVLVGYDMRNTGGKAHFFGNHPTGLYTGDPARFIKNFRAALSSIPAGVEVVCGTPSALDFLPQRSLYDALSRSIRSTECPAPG